MDIDLSPRRFVATCHVALGRLLLLGVGPCPGPTHRPQTPVWTVLPVQRLVSRLLLAGAISYAACFNRKAFLAPGAYYGRPTDSVAGGQVVTRGPHW